MTHHTSTRRRFLQQASGLIAGTVVSNAWSPCLDAADKRAPLVLSCVDGVLMQTKIADCWNATKAVGATGIEASIAPDLSFPRLFHPTRKYSAATAEDLETLKKDAAAAGCKITAFLMATQFDVRGAEEVAWVIKAAQAAQALGVRAIRIDVVKHKSDNSDFLESVTGMLKEVVAKTSDTGVDFGVENHGNTTNDPNFLDALFSGVASTRLGLTLDTGNFYWFGHPLPNVYELFEKYATRVVHTHCKSIGYPADQRNQQRPMGWKYGEYTCPLDQGDIDFRRVIKILRDAGYQNDLCIEDESLDKVPEAKRTATLAKEFDYLKACMADA